MKKYTGELKTIGTGSGVAGRGSTYTFIEIGEHRLKKISVSDALDGVLHEGLKHSEPIDIWVVSYLGKNIIAGVSRRDGTVFRAKVTGVFPAILIALVSAGFLYAGFATPSVFFLIVGFIPASWCIYFANVNRQMMSIPANDAL
jgi:hypothetical protein